MLFDARFYERTNAQLDCNRIKENQYVLKSTITAMISDGKIPSSAKNLILLYLKRQDYIVSPTGSKPGRIWSINHLLSAFCSISKL